VTEIARLSGATCFADPFLPATDGEDNETIVSRTLSWLATSKPRDTSRTKPASSKMEIETV